MSGNYGVVRSVEDFRKFARKLKNDGKPIGFDIEAGYTGDFITKGALQTYHPRWKLVGFSFTNDRNWARYVPINHDDGNNLDEVECARILWDILQEGNAIIHNASYELSGVSRWFRDVLWNDPEYGPAVQESRGSFPFLSDSMMEAMVDAVHEFIGLKAMTKELFGHTQVELESLFPPTAKQKDIRFNVLPVNPEVAAYACEDAAWCLAIHEELSPKILGTKSQTILNIENKLLPVLQDMEYHGLLFDWAAIEAAVSVTEQFQAEMNEQIQTELSRLTGEVININLGSPKQVGEVLFTKLGLPVKARSEKTNEPSTADKALQPIAKDFPIVLEILQWRELGKLLGSYLRKYLEELRYAPDGRAHPNHKQEGARTGRLSVDHVPYQQWPKPYHFELKNGKTYDLNFRDFLIAPEGHRIVGFDFSQVELRLIAAMSHEDDMLRAFANGIDIHTQTASNMLKVPLEDVTDKMRSRGKTFNFAIVYGTGAEAIGESLGVSKEEAQQMLDEYFAGFPKLKAWMDGVIALGKQPAHIVETHFGRKFFVREYLDTRRWITSKGDRMCVNAPVQGGGADYLKLGMVRMAAAIKKAEKDGVWPKGAVTCITTVHDALEFEVLDSVDTQTVIDIIGPAVSFAVPGLPVEIKADWHEGKRWGSVSEIERDADGKISGYSRKIEIYGRDKVKFKSATYQENDEKAAQYFLENPLNQTIVREPAEDDDTPMALLPVEPVKENGIAEALADPEDHSVFVSVGNGDFVETEEEPPWLHATVDEPEPAPEPKELSVLLEDMPDVNQFQKFKAFITERPGIDSMVLVTPEGEVTVSTRHNIPEGDFAQLALIFDGGAQVKVKSTSADLSRLKDKITL